MTWTRINPEDPKTYPETYDTVVFEGRWLDASVRCVGYWSGKAWVVLQGGELPPEQVPRWSAIPALPGEEAEAKAEHTAELVSPCPHGSTDACMRCDLADVAKNFGCPTKPSEPAELVACSVCRGSGELYDKETCGATCFDRGGSGRSRAGSAPAVAECTNCKLRFARHGDIPDEWQCSCGGLVVELAEKPAELVEMVAKAIYDETHAKVAGPEPWHAITATARAYWLRIAETAIEAIRPAPAPEHFDTPGHEYNERHAEEWHEWSVGIGDGIVAKKPARLFVRSEETGAVALTAANVTSWERTARQLDGGESYSICLTTEEIEFLLVVLPKALVFAKAAHGGPVVVPEQEKKQ